MAESLVLEREREREREIERERGRETSMGGWCVCVSLRVMGVYESRCFPIFNVQPPLTLPPEASRFFSAPARPPISSAHV